MVATARNCPVCHRSQHAVFGIIGPPANLIALVALVLAFAQALSAYLYQGSANDAASASVLAMQVADRARADTIELLGKVSVAEAAANNSMHSATEALVQVRLLAADVRKIQSERRQRIDDLEGKLSEARAAYTTLRDELARIPPTAVVQVAREVVVAGGGGGWAGIVGIRPTFRTQTRTVGEAIPNPEYQAVEKQLSEASARLERAEAALLEALND